MAAREVVDRYLAEAFAGGGTAEAGERLIASETLRQRVASMRSAFPDLELETLVLLAEGDLVACHGVGRGTHLGLYQGVPATGRSWEARCTAVYRVEGERIADAWVTWDTLALLEQLGAVTRAGTVSA
ncbi:MAG TPA: ester cyclase [Gaiellaceae bacterium]|jgi:steroid delta-isomerase-like uncharacterized protein|nr:ester cyclase [Gaiellaceae bacterium]